MVLSFLLPQLDFQFLVVEAFLLIPVPGSLALLLRNFDGDETNPTFTQIIYSTFNLSHIHHLLTLLIMNNLHIVLSPMIMLERVVESVELVS